MKLCVIKGSCALLSVLMLFPVISSAQDDILGLQKRMVELYKEHESALVRVKAVYDPSEEDDIPQVVIGTGFFISREGLILTNASIASQPRRVWVEHRSIAYAADVIGYDQRSNVSVLRVNTLPEKFTFLHLVDSPELPEIGSFVVRLSMPMEFPVTPRLGLVGGYESRFSNRFFPCLYMRTTIPAGPGDGGSAYFSLTGKLLGIQVGSLPDIEASYVLPARAALRLRDDLLFSGEVKYGWIGFEVAEKISILNGTQIALSEVFSGGPADIGGLMVGDILLKIGDYDVTNLDELRNAMFYTRVGELVEVIVRRNDKPASFYLKLSERPEGEPFQVLKAGASDGEIEGPIKEKDDEAEVEGVPGLPPS